ncbi:MAG TPA: ribonuclease H-like domain-containing protein [Acidobacteriota bacterium]
MDGARPLLLQSLRRRLQALERRPARWRQPLEELLPGTVVRTARGDCYRHEAGFVDWGRAAGQGVARRLRDWQAAAGAAMPPEELEPGRKLVDADLARVVFFDLETTGFGGPLFLVGTLRVDGERLIVRQLVARDYAEEEAVIQAAFEQLNAAELIVTYNGRSFDLPYLEDRRRALGLKAPGCAPDLDLLPLARKRFRDRLPDCRLLTLERLICGRARFDDIRGLEIPAAYHAFVHDQDGRRLAPVLRHNRMDLATMAELIPRLFQTAVESK